GPAAPGGPDADGPQGPLRASGVPDRRAAPLDAASGAVCGPGRWRAAREAAQVLGGSPPLGIPPRARPAARGGLGGQPQARAAPVARGGPARAGAPAQAPAP